MTGPESLPPSCPVCGAAMTNPVPSVGAAIERARAEERVRCASLVRTHAGDPFLVHREQIAQAIEARP